MSNEIEQAILDLVSKNEFDEDAADRFFSADPEARNCPTCSVPPGEVHIEGCSVARCMFTGLQDIACHGDHGDGPADKSQCGHSVWSGEWPGVDDCRRLGFVFPEGDVDPHLGYPRGGKEDLNRLYGIGQHYWDRKTQRWEA